LINEPLGINIRRAIVLVLVPAILAAICVQVRSQSLSQSDNLPPNAESAARGKLDLIYVRPTPKTTLKNYAFDALGPYAFVGTALTAGLDQETNTPPEWRQGFRAYSKRLGSDFGIAFAGTTARYGSAAALSVDTSYYRCECSGVFPRTGHAILSTLTARRGQNGHRVFSFPALLAPYAGSTTAVYGWYPPRYGVKDALCMGSYSLLESVGANIALEFIYSGPHSLIARMRLNGAHGPPGPGAKP
jgi:hypothetical protein